MNVQKSGIYKNGHNVSSNVLKIVSNRLKPQNPQQLCFSKSSCSYCIVGKNKSKKQQKNSDVYQKNEIIKPKSLKIHSKIYAVIVKAERQQVEFYQKPEQKYSLQQVTDAVSQWVDYCLKQKVEQMNQLNQKLPFENILSTLRNTIDKNKLQSGQKHPKEMFLSSRVSKFEINQTKHEPQTKQDEKVFGSVSTLASQKQIVQSSNQIQDLMRMMLCQAIEIQKQTNF